MEILAIEGPAGAGKTSILKSIISETDAISLMKSEVYDPKIRDQTVAATLYRDMEYILGALEHLVMGHQQVVADRFFLGGIVYDHFIKANKPLARLHTQSYLQNILRIINNLSSHFQSRQHIETMKRIHIKWIFEIPNVGTLQERRKKSGKTYPFDAHKEITGYQKVYNDLIHLKLFEEAVSMEVITWQKLSAELKMDSST